MPPAAQHRPDVYDIQRTLDKHLAQCEQANVDTERRLGLLEKGVKENTRFTISTLVVLLGNTLLLAAWLAAHLLKL